MMYLFPAIKLQHFPAKTKLGTDQDRGRQVAVFEHEDVKKLKKDEKTPCIVMSMNDDLELKGKTLSSITLQIWRLQTQTKFICWW